MTQRETPWKTLLAALALIGALAMPAAAKPPCGDVEIVRAPEIVKAGHAMRTVAILHGCDAARPFNVRWVLMDDAGDKTLLRLSPHRIRSDRQRIKRPMIVPTDVPSGNYGLMIYLTRPNGSVFARDGVSIQVIGQEDEADGES